MRKTLSWLGVLSGVAALAFLGGKPSTQRAQAQPPADAMVYEGGLQSGWQDWSWASRTVLFQETPYRGKPTLRMTPEEFRGIYLHRANFALAPYEAIAFAVHGGKSGGQKLSLCFADSQNRFGKRVELNDYLPEHRLPAGKFVAVSIPLKAFAIAGDTINGVCFQDSAGKPQEPILLAEVRFVRKKGDALGAEATVEVDATKPLGKISPWIYGMAMPQKAHFDALKIPIARWGGNPATRYNWELGNAWNAARDYLFRNGNYGAISEADRQPSGVADKSIATNRAHGADTLLTIPTLGWVARNDDAAFEAKGVPKEGGDALTLGSDAIAGYDPAENRKRISVRSHPRKGKPFADPPNREDDAVYQDEWVYHLTRKFGKANAGGVALYAMDNEPDLWDSTHTDMQPVRLGYDALLKRFLDYATAVKDTDPSAMVTGPVSWGWTGYFFSPKDRGKDNFGSHAERKAHGDKPFVPWFLQETAKHDRARGRRTLDYLDVHFYPAGAGVYEGKTDAETNALRLRSVRALWDADYGDESWIGVAVQLIPRLKQWVRQNYPGTKIAITEWNWGADVTMNGALAIADVLGVFGREGVDLACYWTAPPPDSPGFFAWKIFRNADGKGKGFGDRSLAAVSSDPNRLACFGSQESQEGALALLLINRSPHEAMQVNLKIQSKSPLSQARVFRYSEEDLKAIRNLAPVAIKAGRLQIVLPAYSLTLLRCQ